MININFNKDNNILETEFTGITTLKEIVDYINATRKNKAYPRKLKILTDATTSNMQLQYEDLSKIVAANNRSLEKYDSIIDAIVTTTPNETAITFLYEEAAKNPKYRFKVFFTKEAAESWLLKQ